MSTPYENMEVRDIYGNPIERKPEGLAVGEGKHTPYRPSCGFEGAEFMSAFCDRCVRDQAFRDGTGDSCPIAADTMVFDEDDPRYPKEWVYSASGNPVCTAFARATSPMEGE